MNASSVVKEYLDDEQFRILNEIAAISAEFGTNCYLVGGAVRDVLKGQSSGDLDTMVEHRCSEIAYAVAEKLGGTVLKVTRFGTAALDIGAIQIDISTARRETYEKSGALPKVFPGTIDQDLARRDFTINAMAISLSRDSFGDLIDHHNGVLDLESGVVRVLHNQSFEEDATRILRAIRFAGREGYQLDEHTERLIRRDVRYLETVSGERIRHEIERIFLEPTSSAMLQVANDLKVLQAIHPALGFDQSIVPPITCDLDDLNLIFYGLITRQVSPEDVEPITTRLMLDSVRAAFVNDIVSIRAIVPSLRLSKFNSETYYLLEGLQPLALDAYATFTDDAEAVKRIRLYLDELRFVRPSITGESLLAEGVPEGPWIGQLLKSLLAARLDGDISSYEEEVEFVRRTLWCGS